MQRKRQQQASRTYTKSVGGSYNRTITYKHITSENARLMKIEIINNDRGVQFVTLTFNNNTSLHDFFMSCPREWRDFERGKEIFPDNEIQIDFDKDVSKIKRGHFWVKIKNKDYGRNVELSLSYCEADDQINMFGRSLEDVNPPEFTVHLHHEKNRAMFMQLLAAMHQFQMIDPMTLQEISFQFVTVDDLLVIADRVGLDATFAHVKKHPHEEHLLAGMVHHIIDNTDASDKIQYKRARAYVDKFVLKFPDADNILKRMAQLDSARYGLKPSFREYKGYFFIAVQMREKKRLGLVTEERPKKIFQ